ncbi:13545_t:CDS:2 [Dentiscutata erythropus]|uniref:13545_t:CDS:1 n=1 Tax=Dentiscutata erythropus TaxID=1348616 RepID=A0A9N8WCF7_9GLOM|nr:13545_t:CDS:2 [Dentiscutata erythropus]
MKKANLLRTYSILYNIFVGLVIFHTVAEIISMFISKNTIVNDCISGGQSSGSPSSNSAGDCEKSFWIIAIIISSINILIIFMVIHFALVVASYAASRKEKEMKSSHLTHEFSENNVSYEASAYGVKEKY